jgi:uncharacterized damage-inducible protein DinB
MTLSDRLLSDLNSTFDGDAWHGTPLRRMLDGVDDARAHLRPIADAKTIAELVAHITSWTEIVERRVRFEPFDVTSAMDFPKVEGTKLDDWIVRLEAAHAKLAGTVATLSDADFDKLVPGRPHTLDYTLRGLIHHSTYHAAQIAILKKLV